MLLLLSHCRNQIFCDPMDCIPPAFPSSILAGKNTEWATFFQGIFLIQGSDSADSVLADRFFTTEVSSGKALLYRCYSLKNVPFEEQLTFLHGFQNIKKELSEGSTRQERSISVQSSHLGSFSSVSSSP